MCDGPAQHYQAVWCSSWDFGASLMSKGKSVGVSLLRMKSLSVECHAKATLVCVCLGFTVMSGTDTVSRSAHSAVRNLTDKTWTSC